MRPAAQAGAAEPGEVRAALPDAILEANSNDVTALGLTELAIAEWRTIGAGEDLSTDASLVKYHSTVCRHVSTNIHGTIQHNGNEMIVVWSGPPTQTLEAARNDIEVKVTVA